MANKGINYAIKEAKDELLQLVNQQIHSGVPVTAIELILINLSTSINEVANKVVANEQNKYSEEMVKEQNEEMEKLRKENEPQVFQEEEMEQIVNDNQPVAVDCENVEEA